MRIFVKIIHSRIGEITLSFTDIVNHALVSSQICVLTLFTKIKFSQKFPNLQYALSHLKSPHCFFLNCHRDDPYCLMWVLHFISLRMVLLLSNKTRDSKMLNLRSRGPWCEPHWWHFVVSQNQVFLVLAPRLFFMLNSTEQEIYPAH